MTEAKRARTDDPVGDLDFSKPWKMNDVILIVEDQRFHVHRNVLALWSPVFEKMFTSNFREKNKGEITLPGKQAESVKALLLMIYPPANEEVTLENYNAILELAHEYQIASIVEKCEDFLVEELDFETQHRDVKHHDPISLLILAQKYELEKLKKMCVKCTARYNLNELKEHELCDSIEPENYVRILESIIARMDRAQVSLPSKEALKGIKAKGIKKIDAIVKQLLKHASHKNFVPGRDLNKQDDAVETYLLPLKLDSTHHSCPDRNNNICPGLSPVSPLLRQLKGILESLAEG